MTDYEITYSVIKLNALLQYFLCFNLNVFGNKLDSKHVFVM